MSTTDLWAHMVCLSHHPPLHDNGAIRLHANPTTGELWCYCQACGALGAVKADGRIYGKSTKAKCDGAPKTSKWLYPSSTSHRTDQVSGDMPEGEHDAIVCR